MEAAYRREIGQLGYQPDPAQLAVVEEFQRLADELATRGPRRRGGVLSRLAGWLSADPGPSVRGLYLWGGVGRGKTFLMDLFFRLAPVAARRRVHFHRFMLEVHRALHRRKSEPDPVDRVAAGLAAELELLCFDELFVGDITDAMVLGRLFEGLISRGVVLVFTSNTEIAELYRDGLQRERFQPAIELLQLHCVAVPMGGDTDYRLRTLVSSATYLVPHDGQAERRLAAMFDRLCGDEPVSSAPIEVLGRDIPVRRAAEGVCWFDFAALCEGPRSKADYAELSRFYHTVLIGDVPVLGVEGQDPARRFIELVDELYDRRVNVVMSAAAAPESLYAGTRLAAPFERTASRLREFSSADYMATPHRP